MHLKGIKKLLNIPEYTITGVFLSPGIVDIYLKDPTEEADQYVKEVHTEGYHSSQWTEAEDLPISGKRVYLHIQKRRTRCPYDERIHTEEIPWLKKWARVTRRFAEQISRLTAITTNQEAGWFLGLDDEAIYRIDKEILEEAAQQKLFPPPYAAHISVDEVSYRKYHRYLTNVIDIDRKLLSSSAHYAVNALIVYDKFHIMQKLNGAVDAVRKQELRKARVEKNMELVDLMNCKQRFILLKNRENLTCRQSGYLNLLCELNEPIYKAMLLKESFLTVYSCENQDEAQIVLHRWIDEAAQSALEPFIALAKSFADKMQYILNWFIKKISSAISEGFNNKIKRLKRMVYGYKDIGYFRLKIHQHCGLLNPRLNTVNAT